MVNAATEASAEFGRDRDVVASTHGAVNALLSAQSSTIMHVHALSFACM